MALTQINPALFAGATNTTAVIQSNGTTAITVDSSQNVGVGTSAPDLKLSVAGGLNLRNSNRAGAFEIDSSGNFWAGTATTAGNIYLETGHSTTGLPSTGTARVTVNQYGLGLGATPSSGTGITFPATQSASSDANTLDDYEEGTFTPTGASAGYTISSSNGRYTKIGRLVHCRFDITFSAVPAQNSSTAISGFPFANSTVNPGTGRDNSATGAIYVCNIDTNAASGSLNSYSGVANGSTRTFNVGENYIFSLTYGV